MTIKYTTIAAVNRRLYGNDRIDAGPAAIGDVNFPVDEGTQIIEQIEAAADGVLRRRCIVLPLKGQTASELVGTPYEGLATYIRLAFWVETQVVAYFTKHERTNPVVVAESPKPEFFWIRSGAWKELEMMALENEQTTFCMVKNELAQTNAPIGVVSRTGSVTTIKTIELRKQW